VLTIRGCVDTDLWDGNILASTRPGGGWLCIDPVPLAGDPEYGCAQLLWRRVDRMERLADLDRYLAILADAAGLDIELTRAWSFMRIADYWLWALGHGLTEDPRRCARLLGWLGT
jgi:streptomycin 6-kinase